MQEAESKSSQDFCCTQLKTQNAEEKQWRGAFYAHGTTNAISIQLFYTTAQRAQQQPRA